MPLVDCLCICAQLLGTSFGPISQLMMETEGCGNASRQAKSKPQSWTGSWEPGMQLVSKYATGANPRLVQNDEHILGKGNRPGHVYWWGIRCYTVPGYVSWQHWRACLLAGYCTLQVAGVSAFTYCVLKGITLKWNFAYDSTKCNYQYSWICCNTAAALNT